MSLIEQAIFTSAVTDRAQGYQLISRSPGLTDAEARELSVWGPSHDSLLPTTGEPSSVNFHRLASRAFAISRTTLAGAEYSNRGGALVYTQFLVVPPDVLARFSYNAFAVLRAATASGALCVYEEIPATLEPLRLGGRAPAVDPTVLAQLACRPGPTAMATLLQAALASDQLAVASRVPAEALFAGLINCLPVECRGDFSFSTGLKFSPSRPVRVVALPSDAAEWRAIARHGVTLLNLDELPADDVCWEGWAGCVAQILRSGRISVLAAEFERPRPWLRLTNLDTLAEQMPPMLDTPALVAAGATLAEHARKVEAAPQPVESATRGQRADAAHAKFEGSATAVATARPSRVEGLVQALAAQPPEVLELLERIDDLVFTAIGGDERALTELEVLWPSVVADLDADLIERSREQYLRCALSIWSECVDTDPHRNERAVSAVDVLCVLFEP